jgi:hypothetical protein
VQTRASKVSRRGRARCEDAGEQDVKMRASKGKGEVKGLSSRAEGEGFEFARGG